MHRGGGHSSVSGGLFHNNINRGTEKGVFVTGEVVICFGGVKTRHATLSEVSARRTGRRWGQLTASQTAMWG